MSNPVLAQPRRGRLLLIDDERRILEFVARGLMVDGFDVDVESDAVVGLQAALEGGYDLVIVDLLMPGMDGRQVLERLIAERPAQQVIVLSALHDTAIKVESLQLGAQDYVSKPFELDELRARINARLRSRAAGDTLVALRLRLDVVMRRADAGAGPVALSDREFLLLRELMRRPGLTVSKENLLKRVWGYDFDPGTNVVDVYVRRLRAKLGPYAIRTVRGEGFCVDAA